MSTHREPDPEGDVADAPREITKLDASCPACGGPTDDEGCLDEHCPENPYHVDSGVEEEDIDGDDEDEGNPFA